MTRRLCKLVLLALVLAVSAAAHAAAAEQYVALGDSYSSGTGTRSYYDSGCQRSNYSYAKIIGAERPNTSVNLVACSGAKTGDVLANQVSALSSSTRWASITIGGNDAGFSDVITACALPSWASNCDGKIDTAQSYIKNTLPGKLTSVYSSIKSKAPNATVIVLSYPRLFMGEDCNAGTFFGSGEMTRLNQTADLLRDKIKAAAAAQGSRFVFKDAIGPFTGHAVCSSTEWLNGLSNPLGESYHPNRTGNRSGYVPLVRAVMG
ncbi:MAG: SGNH/GDSL hydrolase family protein [Solirubrobacterales bacterium]